MYFSGRDDFKGEIGLNGSEMGITYMAEDLESSAED